MLSKIKNIKDSIINKEINSDIILVISYLCASLLFAIPSIIYLVKNKTVYRVIYVFTYTFKNSKSVYDNYLNTIIYLGLFFLLFFLYFQIIKKISKIFKTTKSLFIFITIIGILFSIIIPTTSLDVYSYIGNGWVDSNYNKNPYYVSVQDVLDEYGQDQMLGKVARCWRDEPVVYGPVWSLMCKILTSLSFGNITVALYIFKIASLSVFLGSAILIYKITNRKIFAALFALNPFMLFESLSNVHNDIFLVFFILLAIYFIKKKENLSLAVASIAIATGIKYLSILLLPFILVYSLRKENLKNKIIKSIIYILEFILILSAFYLFYVRDLQVLSGIFVQQNKYGRSIFLGLWYLLNGDEKALGLIKMITLVIFAISYIAIIMKMFFSKHSKDISFIKTIKTYQIFLLVFTFVLITNFNPWYVIWLFPTLIWQKAKNIRITLYLSLGALVSYSITYATKVDNESVGIPYLILMISTVLILYVLREIKKEIKKIKNKEMNIVK